MSVSLLELRRAHKLLASFCRRRSAVPGSNTRLSCQQQGDSLLIGELAGSGDASESGGFRPLVKLVYREDRWFPYWQQQDGGWQPWPHLSEAASVQAIIDELEQAPLHVHW
ncbi:MAG: DUF3024 domain-containing protein [Thiogranum sp.]